MFLLLIQIIILVYIIFSMYFIFDMKKYNVNGYIDFLDLFSEKIFKEKYDKLNPIVFKHKSKLTMNYLQDNYSNIFIDDKYKLLKDLLNDNIIYHFKKDTIIKNTNIDELFNLDLTFLEYYPIPINLFNTKSLSIIKGKNISPLTLCKSNYNILSILDNECIIYLFNPKHKDDIINKDINDIKKYSHKYILVKDDTIVIPPNWFYIIEVDKFSVIYHIDVNNIFTIFYNYLK